MGPHLNSAYIVTHFVAFHEAGEEHVIAKTWVFVVDVSHFDDEL